MPERDAHAGTVRIGLVAASRAYVLERARREGELDVPVLHTEILGGLLGISEESVRDERYITYVRGIDAAVAEVREKGAQAAFLLEPTPIDEMARIAFAGGVMPQKSTDFYPKLLSGVTIYSAITRGYHCPQQRRQRVFHPFAGLDHFRVRQLLRQNARRHIGHARNAEHLDPHVVRRDHFGNGRHAHQVGADGAQIADLGGRLVTRSRTPPRKRLL